jgi:bacterioferritin-associated ferredoxin
MYVCVCMAVTGRDIQAAIENGAGSVAEVMQHSGAGSRCGSCRPTIATMLERGEAPAHPLRRSLPIVARNAA